MADLTPEQLELAARERRAYRRLTIWIASAIGSGLLACAYLLGLSHRVPAKPPPDDGTLLTLICREGETP